MSGLRVLEVHLNLENLQWRPPIDSKDEETMLEPLCSVRQAKHFVVFVPWLRPQPEFESQGMPFQIVADAPLSR